MQKEHNYFGVKYGNRKNMTEMLNGYIFWIRATWKKPEANIYMHAPSTALKKKKTNWKMPGYEVKYGFWF